MKQSFPIKIDKVNIELIGDNIRLRWTYMGKRYSLPVGTFSEDSLNAAKSKAHEISGDIYKKQFDFDKYFPKHTQSSEVVKSITLTQLWNLYYQTKLKSGLKEKTKSWLGDINRIVSKLKEINFDSFSVKEALLKITTVEQTRITLKSLSSCCNFGIKRKLILDNPFDGVWEELPDKQPSKPYCFSDSEIHQILTNFSHHPQYNYYTDLVMFLLYTGCRPSESLGITWGDVAKDFSTVTFRGSPQYINGQGIIWSEGSKNYKKGNRKQKSKSRTVPLGQKIAFILEQRKPKNVSQEKLVFPNHEGGYIWYKNFCDRGWSSCVRQIKGLEKATPYNCRDTFITQQLIQGVPIAVIAAWCDNSPNMIESRYADYLRLVCVQPKDF